MTGQGIFSYFTRHKTAANLLLVLMLAAGLVAYPKMRAQYFPDIIVDSISVSVAWQGAGAEDVDAAIVQVLEPALLSINGVTGSDSRSTEGRASIRLEFEPGQDMDSAAEDVQSAIEGITTLPDGADDPVLRRANWFDRVTDVVISGPVGVVPLGQFADVMTAALFEAGVTRSTISGYAAPSIEVEVPSLSLIRHGIGMSDIAAAIGREINAGAAGDVSGTARIRTGQARRSADDIAGIVLRQNADGSTLTIGDVAQINQLGIDRDRALFTGDNPAMLIRVNRTANGDAIGIEQTVREVAAMVQAELPAGVEIELVNSTAKQISGRLTLLLDNGAMGLALVVGLLFLFLNARTALWVALGIPVSMFAAIAVMYAFGLTINMISLFALIITLGIVVDDAIVVGEHADFRARHLGEPPVVAAENAARRMFLPVFSATITTIIAFYGLVIIGGRFGDLISVIPFTVIAVLSASLVECFLILPNHLAHALAHTAKNHWYDLPSRVVDVGFCFFRDRAFKPLMRAVVWARYPVMAAAVLILSGQAASLVSGEVPWRFFSSPEQGTVSGNFAMLPGATRADSLEMMQEMQRATEALGAEYEAEYGVNPLVFVLAQIGGTTGRGLAGADTKESYQLGAITIELIDADLRPYTSGQFVTALQNQVQNHPMAETVSFRGGRAGPGGDAIDIELFGANAEVLKAAAEALKDMLLQFPEVTGPEDSLAYDKEELILQLTPQGRALGFTIDELSRVLRNRLGGIEAATYPDGPRSATVRVELPTGELTADFLDRTQMRAASGDYLPLADIVTVIRRTGFSTVRRENGIMLISVTAGMDDDDADRATQINETILGTILPEIEAVFGIETRMSGLREQEQDFLADAQRGLIFCLTGIYLTLAWIFSSWTRPIIVMAIIPFGLVGAIWGHNLWDVPLSMFSVVGLLGMTGIIINDSIVLVTTIDEHAQTRGIRQAIVSGTAERLRPVFLTTATTVLGLAPLLYEGSVQAEFLKPTVITLVYGLGFGMVLVLLVVPALLAAQSDLSIYIKAAKRALRAGPLAVRLPTVLAVASAAALFGLIVLPQLWAGAPWAAAMAGVLAQLPAALPRVALFAAALAAALSIIYIVFAVFGRKGRR